MGKTFSLSLSLSCVHEKEDLKMENKDRDQKAYTIPLFQLPFSLSGLVVVVPIIYGNCSGTV